MVSNHPHNKGFTSEKRPFLEGSIDTSFSFMGAAIMRKKMNWTPGENYTEPCHQGINCFEIGNKVNFRSCY